MKKLTRSQLKKLIMKEIHMMKTPPSHRERPGYQGARVRGRVARRMPMIEKLAASMGMEAATLAGMLEDELGMGQQEEESEMVMGVGQDPADLGSLAEAAYNRIVERRRRRDALNENAFVDMALSGVKSLSDAERDPGPMRDALVKGLEEMISRMQGADSAESMDEIFDFITMLEKAKSTGLRERKLNEGLSMGGLKKLVDYMAQKGMKYSALGGMAVMTSIGDELIDMVVNDDLEGAAERFMDAYNAL